MKKKILITVFASLIAALPLAAMAQQSAFVPLQPATNTMLQSAYSSTTLVQYLNAVFRIALSVGAILAVVQIVRAGYLYMLKDSFQVKQDAKEIFGDAIIGLLILLSVWLILYQINPDILNLSIVQSTDFKASQ